MITWAKPQQLGSDVVNFTQLALKYAQEHTSEISPVATYNCPANDTGARTSHTFSDLDLGYYLLDSSLGALCTLNTTNPDIEVIDKNAIPTNDKTVQEGSTWGKESYAAIGDVVKFQSNITFESGLDNLTFHDSMDPGLTFIDTAENPVKVILDADASSRVANGRAVELKRDQHYKIVTTELETDNTSDKYNQQVPLKDGCDFHIEFIRTEQPTDGSVKVEDFYDLIATGNHTLTITYSAILNDNAVVADEGNKNTSKLSYGEKGNYTKDSTTTTKTWRVPVYKYATENGTTVGLSDTKFTLSTNADGSGPIQFVKENDWERDITDGAGNTVKEKWSVYRIATKEEIADTNVTKTTEIVTPVSGRFWLKGLDAATYYLTETEAKDGYNLLDKPVTIVVNNDGTIKKNETSASVINIQNNAGSKLPSTGGIGTTIFYVVGGILAAAAVVLLVTKRRMNTAA